MTFSKLWAMQLTVGKRRDDRRSLTAPMQRDKNHFMRVRHRNVALALVVLVLVAPLHAEDRPKEQTRVKDLRALVAHPEPEYPDAALEQLLEGDGVFRVVFDAATGVATSVTVEKSTGHALLDDRGGYGLYRMIVDPNTGRVVEVKVLDTSSSARIDDAALKAFRQWRFRPHTVTSATIPARL